MNTQIYIQRLYLDKDDIGILYSRRHLIPSTYIIFIQTHDSNSLPSIDLGKYIFGPKNGTAKYLRSNKNSVIFAKKAREKVFWIERSYSGPHSVRMQEKTDQNNSQDRTFLMQCSLLRDSGKLKLWTHSTNKTLKYHCTVACVWIRTPDFVQNCLKSIASL